MSVPEQLVGAVHEVAAGGSVVDPKVVESLLATRTRQGIGPRPPDATGSSSVLAEIAQGKNNAAVAATLVLSLRAVEKHINSLFSKLGLTEEADVHRRVKAVLLYLADRSGLAPPAAYASTMRRRAPAAAGTMTTATRGDSMGTADERAGRPPRPTARSRC